MAVAATRTKRIMLGSGVVSVPYHHPFNIANRFALLDQLTHGRVMLGCGPGALPARRPHARDRDAPRSATAWSRGCRRSCGSSPKRAAYHDRRLVLHAARRPSAGEAVPEAASADFRRQHVLAVGDGRGGQARMRRAVGRDVRPGGLDESAEALGDGRGDRGRKRQDGRPQELAAGLPDASRGVDARGDRRTFATARNRWIREYFIDTLGARIQFEEYPNQPTEEMKIDRMIARGGAIVGTPDDADREVSTR